MPAALAGAGDFGNWNYPCGISPIGEDTIGRYSFTMAPLPKPIYNLLKAICETERLTQRQVLAAGVLGLHRLREIAPEHLGDVLAEAKRQTTRKRDVPSF